MLNEVQALISIFVSCALELHNVDYIILQQLFGLMLIRHAQLLFLLGDIRHVRGFRISECREPVRFVGLRFWALGRQVSFGYSLHIQQVILSRHASSRAISLEQGSVCL